jgi:hypothetical protein
MRSDVLVPAEGTAAERIVESSKLLRASRNLRTSNDLRVDRAAY